MEAAKQPISRDSRELTHINCRDMQDISCEKL